MRTLIITGILASVLGAWALWPETDGIPPETFARELQVTTGEVLIDLRTTGEFAAGHISGAINIDYTGPVFRWRMAAIDTATTLFIYGADTDRATRAEATLRTMGFIDITALDDGFPAWKAKKLPVTPRELVPPADLTAQTFSRLLDLEHLVIVDFYIPWDKACRRMEPVLDELAVDYGGKVLLLRIDVDTYKYLATELGIEELPVLQFYENGNLTGTITGEASAERIEQTFRLREYTGGDVVDTKVLSVRD